jgi:hypothetical protein
VKQTDNFLFSAQGFSRNTAAERPEEGSQGWSTQPSGVRNPWSTEVLKLVALKGRQQWPIVEGAFRQLVGNTPSFDQSAERTTEGNPDLRSQTSDCDFWSNLFEPYLDHPGPAFIAAQSFSILQQTLKWGRKLP